MSEPAATASTPLIEISGARATIRLNRPKHLNRLQPDDLDALLEIDGARATIRLNRPKH